MPIMTGGGEMLKMQKTPKTIWKWMSFLGWSLGFLVTFPWQLHKAYNQFIYATSPRLWKKDDGPYSGRYFEHFK